MGERVSVGKCVIEPRTSLDAQLAGTLEPLAGDNNHFVNVTLVHIMRLAYVAWQLVIPVHNVSEWVSEKRERREVEKSKSVRKRGRASKDETETERERERENEKERERMYEYEGDIDKTVVVAKPVLIH